MQEQTTENYVTQESLLKKVRIPPGSRKVLVKIVDNPTDQTTESGIIKIASTDTDWSPAVHASRKGVVMAVPRGKLPFKKNADLMPWQTDVQISPGMTVWFDFMNAVTYEDESENEYKLLDYDNIYVATFPRVNGEEIDWAQPSTDGKEWVMPLNGFHLFERVYKKQRGRFDVFESEKVDTRHGVVKYVAKNNGDYSLPGQEDHIDLQVGDEVQFGQVPEVMLEDEYYCSFDGGTMYRRSQARNVELAWRDGELILPRGRYLIRQIPDEKITPSGIILPRENVKNHRGEVIVSSGDEIKEGDVVCYLLNGGVPMEYKGEKLRLIKDDHILFIEG
jgi:co-chaperonin GroES (HSP10)